MSAAQPRTKSPEDIGESKCAIDDTVYEDEAIVEGRRTKSVEHKRKQHDPTILRVQETVPFHFSPIFLPLTPSNVDSCVALENAAFRNPDHRCTPEKFEYRLTTGSDICFGLFCSVKPAEARAFGLETIEFAKPVETNREDGEVFVLCAHVISTMGKGPVVTDNDMKYPTNWRDASAPKELGNQLDGRTVCVHSLAVSPKLQGTGIGKLAMASYIQIMNESGVADRIALLCQEHLIGYYEELGFENLGESKATFGGGGWYDMVMELEGPSSKD
ncbi:polyamine acetyltransferase [Sodiomyces alkalinus F11]|uniref:Polyamine acetyltransferase n=1 Tax=Sodiomyces alkalinus (strain CBS 110278 / VKM F-3762 / F11) TaxID=1314773 RepID=A0A3N2PW59_SODAK|nr:polyamine acetyltransferase [Sodiomyces alkalinus F11]ROT38606.1 polyamine acetyltransferase [Sodiomyces alkalinus F11]